MLLDYHIGCLVLSSLCVRDLVRKVLSGACLQAEAQHKLCLAVDYKMQGATINTAHLLPPTYDPTQYSQARCPT